MSALSLPVFTRRKYVSVLSNTQRSIDAEGIVVRKRATYITIPAFSITSTWRGASEIIAKFNYTLGQKITLLDIPDNETFCACISWKPTSDTIVRYKLWEDVGEILYEELYIGQVIPNSFSIEIWNIKPNSSAGFGVISEDGSFLIGTESGDSVVTEGSLIGTQTDTVFGGTILLRTSLMILPTSPFCDLSTSDISGTVDTCTDILLFFGDYVGSLSDDFVPYDGDYFQLNGNCGEADLVKGPRLIDTGIVLQATDLTWHNVYVMRVDDYSYIAVDQEPTDPSDTPYIYLQITPGVGHKVDILEADGFYYINPDQQPTSIVHYAVAYFQSPDDTLYYGVRLTRDVNGFLFLNPDQTSSIP